MEMTDINNLRRLALGGELSTILEILNRLELAEKGRDELRVAVCREGDRADAYQMDVIILRTKLAQLYKEADKFDDGIDWIQRALQAEAKIEAMEKQKPVAQVGVHKTGGNAGIAWSARPLNEFDSLPLLCDGDKLYALPGAKGE